MEVRAQSMVSAVVWGLGLRVEGEGLRVEG